MTAAPTAQQIARKEERRQAQGLGAVSTDTQPLADGVACWAGIKSWANRVVGVGMADAAVDDGLIDRAEAFYLDRGTPECRFELCAYTHPSLVKNLGERGYALSEFELVYGLTLPEDPEQAFAMLAPYPPGVTIEQVDRTDVDAVNTYIHLNFRSQAIPDVGAPPADDIPKPDPDAIELYRRIVCHPQVDSFLGYVDGEVACSGAMEAVDGHGCFFSAATSPAFRRRGLHGALFSARVRRAIETSTRTLVVATAPGGPTERNAQRKGFTPLYTRALFGRALEE